MIPEQKPGPLTLHVGHRVGHRVGKSATFAQIMAEIGGEIIEPRTMSGTIPKSDEHAYPRRNRHEKRAAAAQVRRARR